MSQQFDKYVKAAIPDRYTIFGVVLRPLSLGHLLLMKRHGCGFAEDKETNAITVIDLLIAVAICSRKYQEFIDWYNDDDARNSWLTKWYKSIRKESHKKGWALMNKFSLFNMYRKEGIEVPLFFDEEENKDAAKESGAHWTQNIITALVTEGRFNDVEIYDIPISKAFAEYFKILENKGLITLMPDWQIEEIKKQETIAKELAINGK
jgi:hypothetical protein